MTPRRSRKTGLSQAPLAVASDGAILLNVGQLVAGNDIKTVFLEAVRLGGEIFVGVPMSRGEVKDALAALDDAAAEISARVGGRRKARP